MSYLRGFREPLDVPSDIESELEEMEDPEDIPIDSEDDLSGTESVATVALPPSKLASRATRRRRTTAIPSSTIAPMKSVPGPDNFERDRLALGNFLQKTKHACLKGSGQRLERWNKMRKSSARKRGGKRVDRANGDFHGEEKPILHRNSHTLEIPSLIRPTEHLRNLTFRVDRLKAEVKMSLALYKSMNGNNK